MKRSISNELSKTLSNVCKDPNILTQLENIIEEPPKREFGDLSIHLARLSKLCNIPLENLTNLLSSSLEKLNLVEKVVVVGNYVNIFINYAVFSAQVLKTITSYDSRYGLTEDYVKKRVIVEYVSANPVHPLHLGSGRNAILGDFLYRLNKFLGNEVQRRYYVNDVGLQAAFLAYGYYKLGFPDIPPGMKPDHYLGLIYAATTTIIDILKLRKSLKEAEASGDLNRASELRSEIDSLMSDLARLAEVIPNEVNVLAEKIASEEDPELEVLKILRGYEKGEPEYLFVRKVCSKVIDGIKETLEKINTGIDVWDWESDLVWEGRVDEILEKAADSAYFGFHKGAPALFFKDLLSIEELRKRLRIPEVLEVPPLILRRSDGTTLYTTRDIAYTLKKFREFSADEVINVIAIEQTLSQAQLRLALYALGYEKEAENLIHYSYEMVNLPGASMSGRRGRYVTVDELLEGLSEMVKNLMKERGSEVSDEQALKIARSAIKYMVLSVSPSKTLTIDLKRILDLKQNSGPYIQYTYVRARSVIEKVRNYSPEIIDYGKASKEPIRTLILELSKFPEVISDIVSSKQPEDLVAYANNLATIFNKFYESEPILREPDEGFRALKIAVTHGVLIVLRNFMEICGIDILEKI
ncbi:MAG: arginine--tRNA ligase [Desulfurococcaceae archaeon TW002]